MNDNEMESLLRNIAQMSGVVYGKEPHWNCKTMDLPPAAVTRAITKLAKQLPFKLPPSYVQFLRLHDGCVNFWPSWTLFGIAQDKEAWKAVPHSVVFGQGEAGEFLVFNTKKKSKDGEQEVLLYRDGRIDERYPTFAAFLGTTAYLLQQRILDKGYSAAVQRQVKKAKVKGV
jgi:phytoene dehydrogenase-like protein